MAGQLSPENTTFVMLSFEGPDAYARAGGLGVRVTELSTALAETGYRTHLFFVGDPAKPGEESLCQGRLIAHRWCQWISEYYPGGVYQGEEEKLNDYSVSAPDFIAKQVIKPLLAEDGHVVVMAEEWQTAEAICRLNDLLLDAGVRDRAVLFWNANNAFGFHRVNWRRLDRAATITTVSRFMKQLMWDFGVNPLVIPNGIPRRMLDPLDGPPSADLRAELASETLLLKVARWDPDKRWLSAMHTVARLKSRGARPVLPGARWGRGTRR